MTPKGTWIYVFLGVNTRAPRSNLICIMLYSGANIVGVCVMFLPVRELHEKNDAILNDII